jgi:anti-sigma B factor antagonist
MMEKTIQRLEELIVTEPLIGLSYEVLMEPCPSLVVGLSGSLETSNSSKFQTAMINLMGEETWIQAIVVDLGHLQYISSTGIGSFTVLFSSAHKHDMFMYLANVPEKINSLLHFLGLWDYLAIKVTVAEAIAEAREKRLNSPN